MQYIKAARADELGQRPAKAVRILLRYVALWKTPDGQVHALDVSCGHQGANLLAGHRQGDVVTCPRHQWRYSLKTGECLEGCDVPLKRYPVKVEGDYVYIGIEQPGGW
jgi:nitrite reductase/ring-hydroxylating ferredoxin subunit